MVLRWYSVVIEARDHRALGSWWAEALGWVTAFDSDDEVVLWPPWGEEFASDLPFDRVPPGLVFVPVEHEKQGKNRLHFDFAPHVGQDRDAEIERLVAMGATRVDVGQGDKATWDVLADPEGNEFCMLSSREA